MYWSDGRVYKGFWLNGIQNGETQMIINNNSNIYNKLPQMNYMREGRQNIKSPKIHQHSLNEFHDNHANYSLPPVSNSS